MPEILSKQTGKELSPELRKQFKEVQHVKEAGRIAIYGIDKKTSKKKRIGTKAYIEAWKKSPEPQRAVGMWNSGGGEVPVTIVGTYGKTKGGVEHLRAHGSKERIPRDKIEWLSTNKNSDSARVKKLEKQVEDLALRLQEMDDRLKEQNKENGKLKTKNTDLQTRLDGLTNGNLLFEPEIIERQASSKPRSFFNRGSGWIGSRMPWRGEPNYPKHRIEERPDGPVVVATEERVDGYRNEDRRRGAAVVLGTIAAIGVGVLAGYLWGEHEEHEGRNQTPALTAPATPHIEHDATAGIGQRHVAKFKGLDGFKVSLPGNLNWQENDNGSYRIDDTEGHHIVPHVYWDQQGNLDVDSRQLLRTTPYHNFHLEQVPYDYHTTGTQFNEHYKTIVKNQ